MTFILLPSGSGGFSIENLLTRWFPPSLTSLNREAHREVLAYQYRITRKGDDHNPKMLMGARIIRKIIEPY